MTLLMLQEPWLLAVCAACSVLCGTAVRFRRIWLVSCAVVCLAAMVMAALACMLPYQELLLLLLPPLFACFVLMSKENAQ